MQHYELFYIVPSKYTDAEVVGVMKKVGEVVVKHGGKVNRHEDGGKIKFAYPINKVRHGNYILMEFEAETTAPISIEKELHLGMNNEVLRFTLLRQDEASRGKPLQLASYVPPLSAEEPEVQPVAAAAAAPIMQAPRPTTPVKVVSAEELDKKIDEVLAEDAAKL